MGMYKSQRLAVERERPWARILHAQKPRSVRKRTRIPVRTFIRSNHHTASEEMQVLAVPVVELLESGPHPGWRCKRCSKRWSATHESDATCQ